MAQQYRVRPSDLLGLEDEPLLAYYFDRAAYTWGRRVEQEIEAANSAKTEQGKTMKLAMVQSRWLGVNRFASPAAYQNRKRG